MYFLRRRKGKDRRLPDVPNSAGIQDRRAARDAVDIARLTEEAKGLGCDVSHAEMLVTAGKDVEKVKAHLRHLIVQKRSAIR